MSAPWPYLPHGRSFIIIKIHKKKICVTSGQLITQEVQVSITSWPESFFIFIKSPNLKLFYNYHRAIYIVVSGNSP